MGSALPVKASDAKQSGRSRGVWMASSPRGAP